jgi:murein DD-endopeptidase
MTQKSSEQNEGPPTRRRLPWPTLVLQVPIAPTPMRADAKIHLVYELHLTNFGRDKVTLTEIQVLGDEQGAEPLVSYTGEALSHIFALVYTPREQPETPCISAGVQAVVFFWLTLESSANVPHALNHRVTFRVNGGDDDSESILEGGKTEVCTDRPPLLGPPLRGGNWLAVNGPSNAPRHRRGLIPSQGKAAISQRFAIDWVQINLNGKMFAGDGKVNADHYAYGAEVLAVADGTVVAIKDGIPENAPGLDSRAVPITLETVSGNYIMLDLERDRYAFYAHLIPGSLGVQSGDKVKRGDILGLVGNSGNSTAPHLHFHVGNGIQPLGAEGLPYEFDAFTQRQVTFKSQNDISTNISSENTSIGPEETRETELPLEWALVTFSSE